MTAFIKTVGRTEWQKWTAQFLDYNYRQVWDFGIACAKRFNATSEHIVIQDNQDILGIADVRIKRIPIIGGGIGYINGGPLVRKGNEDDNERLKACLIALVQYYVMEQGLLLRIRACLGPNTWNARQKKVFEECGFSIAKSLKPYRTFLLNLDPPLEELRKNLAKKWRYNLKKAEKNIHTIESNSTVESFEHFTKLYKPFRMKKQFNVDLGPDFFKEVQKLIPESERFRVALCEQDGELVSGHVSSQLGDTAVNLFRANAKGALSNRVSYRIQWDGVRNACENGFRFYDLGGIDPESNPGVYSFKKGMGGQDVTVPGPFEYYPNGFKRKIVPVGEWMYNMFRRRR